MSEPSFDSEFGSETGEFLKLVTALIRYKRHVIDSLPEDISRIKRRFYDQPASKELRHGGIDNFYFYRISVTILSQYKELMPMGELSKALDVPLSTATRIVDGLVDSGVAERSTDPEDRRVVRVTLTEEGRNLYRILNKYMKDRVNQILSTFTSEERGQLLKLLGKIVRNMDDEVIRSGVKPGSVRNEEK